MTTTTFTRLCAEAEIAPAEIPSGLIASDQTRHVLTGEGIEVAKTWRQIVDRDPRVRLDIDFWPEPAQEPEDKTWDWADDPLPTG